MPLAIPLPAVDSARVAALEEWMDRVLHRGERVSPDWNVDDVHDLRVALRRCRTIAEALSEVNPDSGWRKLKKTSRELFRVLGGLHDTQVERSHLKKLRFSSGADRKKMLGLLSRRERKQRKSAQQALERFDRKEWKKLAHKLSSKACFFPLGSVVFQRLALVRLNVVAQLHQQAKIKRSSVGWHHLRVGLKHFRYVVENFLPQPYAVWSEDLKRMQDLLGDVHDLDVLRADIRQHASKLELANTPKWIEKIERERKARLQEFAAKTAGAKAPWPSWRQRFQLGHTLDAAPAAQRRTA